MAKKVRPILYKYKIEMTYLNLKNKKNKKIDPECIQNLIIDNQYDDAVMPILFVNLSLDKKLVDNMIKNVNDNLFMLAIYKFDDLTKTKEKIECFRKKFMYYLPNKVNKNNDIDYTKENAEEHTGQTFRNITVGLLCLEHVNNNKQSIEINVKNNTMYDVVKYVTSGFNDIMIEPFSDNTTFPHFIMSARNSVRKTLMALNDYRVFYATPYRYFQDFDYAYVISSSCKPLKKKTEKYDTIVVTVRDILNDEANDVGFYINNVDKTYQVDVNYSDTDVFDNTLANKSKNSIKGVTSKGSKTKKLKNQSKNSKEKTNITRLNNDNSGMLDNMEADANSNNFFLYFNKSDLDINLFTINKKISIKNIDRYREFDGTYIMYRKRDCFFKEDDMYTLTEMINLRKLD